MAVTILPERARRNFLRRTAHDATTGCLLWTGAVNRGGYGVFHFGQRSILAHRAAWFLAGRILSDECPDVLHVCDTRRCCAIAHLWAGNKRLNMLDMSRKKRGRKNNTGLPFGVEELPGGSFRARAYLEGRTVHLGVYLDPAVAGEVAVDAKASEYLNVLLPPLD